MQQREEGEGEGHPTAKDFTRLAEFVRDQQECQSDRSSKISNGNFFSIDLLKVGQTESGDRRGGGWGGGWGGGGWSHNAGVTKTTGEIKWKASIGEPSIFERFSFCFQSHKVFEKVNLEEAMSSVYPSVRCQPYLRNQ